MADKQFRQSPPFVPPVEKVSPDGVTLIARERRRQITVHRFDDDRDAAYTHNQLVSAAVHYALPGTAHGGRFWPSTWTRRWDQKADDDRITQLAKAGALIAAEIDRLQRAAASVAPSEERGQ